MPLHTVDRFHCNECNDISMEKVCAIDFLILVCVNLYQCCISAPIVHMTIWYSSLARCLRQVGLDMGTRGMGIH